MADLQKFVDEIKNLTAIEISELVKKLEVEFGVSAAAVAVAGASGAPAAAAAAEEKTEFTVALKEVGPNKLAVIKAVKDLTGLGLGDAKGLVDKAPSVIKENVPAKEAKEMEAKLKEAGAVVELK